MGLIKYISCQMIMLIVLLIELAGNGDGDSGAAWNYKIHS